jgi:antitoxin ParD1/3/4
MSKTTSFVLGDHFEKLITQQLQSGRYASASEIVREALRLLEQQQTAIQRLNNAIEEGYASGCSEPFDWAELFEEAAVEA